MWGRLRSGSRLSKLSFSGDHYEFAIHRLDFLSLNVTVNNDLRSNLISAARALDSHESRAALEALVCAPLVPAEASIRRVALSLWKSLVRSSSTAGLDTLQHPEQVSKTLDLIFSAASDEELIWDVYRDLPFLEKELGPRAAGAVIATLFWKRILDSPGELFIAVFELFFRSQNIEQFDAAWYQFLRHRTDYVPDYWRFHLYIKSLLDRGRSGLHSEVERCLRATDRADLAPLMTVYLALLRQEELETTFKQARELKDPHHRTAIAKYLLDAPHTSESLPLAAALFRDLSANASLDAGAEHMMASQLATAEKRWSDVIHDTAHIIDIPHYNLASQLLRAHALGHLGKAQQARTCLEHVARSSTAAPFQRANAALIGVTVDRLERGVALPEDHGIATFRELPGRPLAQSLWVGTTLRWIERLAICSYLENGWRFQLYVYDEVDNVPEGCEVLDANAIIPHREVFREGVGSGLHAGSVGAFSDLFRYRLLHQRGGMWTDTDVINFRKFDPDGRRFISTEVTDAGIVGVNGAMMAAPAGDAFLEKAYERARELLKSDEMFFTRIGPHLLAELLVEEKADEFELMGTRFLNPVPWMRASLLLQPYEIVAARPEIRDAVNLHVYTETWRRIGLELKQPPAEETFLGHLYGQYFGAAEIPHSPVYAT